MMSKQTLKAQLFIIEYPKTYFWCRPTIRLVLALLFKALSTLSHSLFFVTCFNGSRMLNGHCSRCWATLSVSVNFHLFTGSIDELKNHLWNRHIDQSFRLFLQNVAVKIFFIAGHVQYIRTLYAICQWYRLSFRIRSHWSVTQPFRSRSEQHSSRRKTLVTAKLHRLELEAGALRSCIVNHNVSLCFNA